MSAATHASTQAEADILIPEAKRNPVSKANGAGAQRSGSNRLSEVPHTSVCGQAEADFIIPEAKRNPRQGAKVLAKWDNSPLSAKPPRSGTILHSPFTIHHSRSYRRVGHR